MNDDIGLLRSLTTEVWIVKKKKKDFKGLLPFSPPFHVMDGSIHNKAAASH